MTTPTISYDHGFCETCQDVGTWADGGGWGNGNYTLGVANGLFKITAQFTDALASGEYFHLHTSINATLYPKWVLGYKTSASSNGAGIMVSVHYTTGETEWIVGNVTTPVFSTTTKRTSGTFAGTGIIDEIDVYAAKSPDALAPSTHYVYLEFMLIHHGTFTFPYVNGSVETILEPRNVYIPIPGRDGDVTQNLGTSSFPIIITGDMDTGPGWKGDNVIGEVFYDIALSASSEPFQWFTCDLYPYGIRVTLDSCRLRQDQVFAMRTYQVVLKEYVSSTDTQTYVTRAGLV